MKKGVNVMLVVLTLNLIALAMPGFALDSSSNALPATSPTESISNLEKTTKPGVISGALDSTVTEGYYVMLNSNRGTGNDRNHELFVKAIVDEEGYKNFFALIRWGANFISMYRIEPIDAFTEAWVPLMQNSEGHISTSENQQPTYLVNKVMRKNAINLIFAMQTEASKIGRKQDPGNVPCTITPTFVHQPGSLLSWGSISQLQGAGYKVVRARPSLSMPSSKRYGEISLSNPVNTEMQASVSNLVIETLYDRPIYNRDSGGYVESTQEPQSLSFNGLFRGEEVLPGVLKFRSMTLDSTKERGVRMNAKGDFFVFPIVQSVKGGVAQLKEIEVAYLPPGRLECAYLTSKTSK